MPKADKYVNRAYVSLTMSAANTITFNKLDASVSITDKVGWLIHRIEYHPQVSTLEEMTASGDYLWMGLTSSDQLSDLHVARAAVFDSKILHRMDGGTAGNFERWEFPIITDWSDLPSGGVLVPPDPLYLGMNTVGLASAGVLRCRLIYSLIKLSPADYWDLVETTRLTG